MPADILTVTLNPTLDVTTSVPVLMDQVKLRCTPAQEQVGGGGINVAHVVHSLGGQCQAMLPAGGTRGQEIVERLRESGLPVVTTPIAEQSRECFNVFETDTGREYRFVLPGPHLSASEQQACIDTVVQALPRRFLVCSGSLPPGVDDDFYARLIASVRAKAPDLQVVIDTSGPALKHALEAGVYMIKPSREEFEVLTQTKITSPAQAATLCQAIIASGKTHVLALSLGRDGAVVVTAQAAWHVMPLPVTVTSTVGAGDSFVGGMVWAMTSADDLAHAARVATACAAAALQTQGRLHFDTAAVLANAQRVQITGLSTPL